MKTAIILFNLGGPDGPGAVKPFLFNLFNDPAIIRLPQPLRWLVAKLISGRRAPIAAKIYEQMGGRSPILPNTEAQAAALEAALGPGFKCFIVMRYWHPRADVQAAAVKAWGPDRILLLPLYPQYSTTTTGSSLQAWSKAYAGSGRVHAVCCYPTGADLVAAHAARIEEAFEAAGRPAGVRLLFSAHGLPMQVVEGGDPYQAQIEATAAAVVAKLGGVWDWRVCYQSKVGPLPWLGPSTLEEIEAAGNDGVGVLITPIAFVSEHVETLVELDHDYAGRAAELGVSTYLRVPALGVQSDFIESLASVVLDRVSGQDGVRPGSAFQCPGEWTKCPCRGEGSVKTTETAA